MGGGLWRTCRSSCQQQSGCCGVVDVHAYTRVFFPTIQVLQIAPRIFVSVRKLLSFGVISPHSLCLRLSSVCLLPIPLSVSRCVSFSLARCWLPSFMHVKHIVIVKKRNIGPPRERRNTLLHRVFAVFFWIFRFSEIDLPYFGVPSYHDFYVFC